MRLTANYRFNLKFVHNHNRNGQAIVWSDTKSKARKKYDRQYFIPSCDDQQRRAQLEQTHRFRNLFSKFNRRNETGQMWVITFVTFRNPNSFFFGVFSAKFHRTCTKTRSGRAAVRCEEEGYFVSIFLTLLWFMHDEIAFPFSFHWQWVGQIVCKLFQTHAHTLVAFWLQHKFGASFTCRIVFTYLKIFTGLYNNNQRKKNRTAFNYLKFSVCLTSNTMLFLQSLSSSSFLLLLFWKMTPHLNIFRVWLAQCSVMNWMRTTYVEDCFISFRFVPFRIESSCSMFV